MKNRSAIALTLSLFLLLAVILWVYTAKIVSSVAPQLLSNESIRIDALEVSSLTFNQVFITRLEGSTWLESGRIRFSIRNASVNYNLIRLDPGRIEIEQAKVEHDFEARTDISPEPSRGNIIFPPQLTIDQLAFRFNDGLGEFNGHFELDGTDKGFSLLAEDEWMRLEVKGDAALTDFDLRMQQPDRSVMANARVVLNESAIDVIEGTLYLEPLTSWLQSVRLLPGNYQDYVDQVRSVSGTLTTTVRPNGKDWRAHLIADIHNLNTDQYYISGKLEGNADIAPDEVNFVTTRPGTVRLHIPSYQLDQISTLSAELPTDYTVHWKAGGKDHEMFIGRGSADVSLQQTGDLDVKTELTEWSLRNWRDATISLRNIEVAAPFPTTADGGTSDLSVTNAAPLLAKGNLVLTGVRVPDLPEDLQSVDIAGDWNWNDTAFDFSGAATWGNVGATLSLVNHIGSGEIRIDLDEPAVNLVSELQSYLQTQQQDVSVTDGSVAADVKWTWDNGRYDNRLALKAEGLNGRVLGLELANGSINVSSSDLVTPSLQIRSSVPAVSLANSMSITDLQFSGRWQNGLYIDRAEMSVLGGSVKMTPSFLGFDVNPQALELEVARISLEEIFDLIDQEGLSGTGLLSGTIPLSLADSGMAVNDGELKNDTKGTISYRLDDGATTQLNNIALQALQDFRYNILNTHLNYQTNGDYVIRVRLEGRNPDLYDGYPVAFNINLTGSLPGLLRASLVTGDFHGEILKQIQQQ